MIEATNLLIILVFEYYGELVIVLCEVVNCYSENLTLKFWLGFKFYFDLIKALLFVSVV